MLGRIATRQGIVSDKVNTHSHNLYVALLAYLDVDYSSADLIESMMLIMM